MISYRIFLTACVAILAMESLALAAESAPPSVSCIAAGTWYSPDKSAPLSTSSVLNNVKGLDAILLGETHIIADHHRWQVQIAAQIFSQSPGMVLGFEAFPRRVQPILDQWVAGDLSEAAFLKSSEWDTVWRYDANLYLPLFHFARLNHIPMLALNVDRSLIHKVSKVGWAGVPQAERLGLSDPSPPSAEYIDMLGQYYSQHDNGKGQHNGRPKRPGLNDPHFSNFVDVQLTWDRAMAEAIATTLKGKNTRQMVAVIGRGHLDYGYGVPHQLAALGIHNVAVLEPWDTRRPCSDLRSAQGSKIATAVFGLALFNDAPVTAKPKLGVMIDTAQDGVHVSGILKESVAESSGLLKNDIITMAGGHPLKTTGDLIAIVQAMVPGTWLPLTIQRKEATMEMIARFPVTQQNRHHR